MKTRKTLIAILFILLSFQLFAYEADFKTVVIKNAKSWTTKADNCGLYITPHNGTGDIYLLAQQNRELLEVESCPDSNCQKFSIGYHNKFVVSLDRYKLEERIFSKKECQDGSCEFKMSAIELIENSAKQEKMREQGDQFEINVVFNKGTVQINKVFITDDKKEFVNCYK